MRVISLYEKVVYNLKHIEKGINSIKDIIDFGQNKGLEIEIIETSNNEYFITTIIGKREASYDI